MHKGWLLNRCGIGGMGCRAIPHRSARSARAEANAAMPANERRQCVAITAPGCNHKAVVMAHCQSNEPRLVLKLTRRGVAGIPADHASLCKRQPGRLAASKLRHLGGQHIVRQHADGAGEQLPQGGRAAAARQLLAIQRAADARQPAQLHCRLHRTARRRSAAVLEVQVSPVTQLQAQPTKRGTACEKHCTTGNA